MELQNGVTIENGIIMKYNMTWKSHFPFCYFTACWETSGKLTQTLAVLFDEED